MNERRRKIDLGAGFTWSVNFASWPSFGEDEIAVVKDVLGSGKVNYWTGDEGRKFEMEFAHYCKSGHAVALCNGSVALELALKSLDIRPDDEVIVPSRTFVATASSVIMCGARPVFADVDPDSQNISAASIKSLISTKTKAIIVVHLAGWPCDMDPIMDLAKEHGLKVIEDCAQAHGASYKGRPVGSIGDVAAFSFCQDKIMTTGGEGGMLLTNDEAVWRFSWEYKDHGKSYDALYVRERQEGELFRWVHESFGTNWRMTEMQSALGRVQLSKLTGWVAQRQENAGILAQRLSSCHALRVPMPGVGFEHAFYKFYAFVIPENLKPGWTRNRLIHAINAKGVPCFYGSCSEVYREKSFIKAGLAPAERLPVAKMLGETSLMFLVHPTLTSDDMHRMADVVDVVLDEAGLR
jgi:dTDP-4-amino-4,6-dideoxygalactose transaminase